MRIAGTITLGLVATVIGLLGGLFIGVSGLLLTADGFAWAGYSDTDPTESAISVGMGLAALAVWTVFLLLAAGPAYSGPAAGRRARRIVFWVVVAVSAVAVLGLCGAALFAPQPPSEIPSPPWNRA